METDIGESGRGRNETRGQRSGIGKKSGEGKGRDRSEKVCRGRVDSSSGKVRKENGEEREGEREICRSKQVLQSIKRKGIGRP